MASHNLFTKFSSLNLFMRVYVLNPEANQLHNILSINMYLF